MKQLLIAFFLLSSVNLTFSQTEAELFKNKQLANGGLIKDDLIKQFIKYDFSKLWTITKNSEVFGFIGDNYQRIRIKFISVAKSKSSPDTYDVYGRSMVKNNVDEFRGTIKITNVRKTKTMSYGPDNQLKNKGLKGQFIIVGDYNFAENPKQNHSGIFKGVFLSNFYLDKNNAFHYNDIEPSDSFNNNQFVGQWRPYNNDKAKRCNWGDYRIPNYEFDIGAGDFSPSKGEGWESYRDLSSPNKKVQAKAKVTEEAKWWQ